MLQNIITNKLHKINLIRYYISGVYVSVFVFVCVFLCKCMWVWGWVSKWLSEWVVAFSFVDMCFNFIWLVLIKKWSRFVSYVPDEVNLHLWTHSKWIDQIHSLQYVDWLCRRHTVLFLALLDFLNWLNEILH